VPTLDELRARFKRGRAPKPNAPRPVKLPDGVAPCAACGGRGTVDIDGGPSGRLPRSVKCGRCGGSGCEPKNFGAEPVEAKRGEEFVEEHPRLAGGDDDARAKRRFDPRKFAERRMKVSREKYKLATDAHGQADAIIFFGKHKGSKVSELAHAEPKYLMWILGEEFDAELKHAIIQQLGLDAEDFGL